MLQISVSYFIINRRKHSCDNTEITWWKPQIQVYYFMLFLDTPISKQHNASEGIVEAQLQARNFWDRRHSFQQQPHWQIVRSVCGTELIWRASTWFSRCSVNSNVQLWTKRDHCRLHIASLRRSTIQSQCLSVKYFYLTNYSYHFGASSVVKPVHFSNFDICFFKNICIGVFSNSNPHYFIFKPV